MRVGTVNTRRTIFAIFFLAQKNFANHEGRIFFAYDGIEPILQLNGASDTNLTDR